MRDPDRAAAPVPARLVGSRLDPSSRLCVRSFLGCVLLLLAFSLPYFILGPSQPGAGLYRMKLVFGTMGWVLVILAVQQGRRPLGPSLNRWDEAAAFFGLALACSVAAEVAG